MQQIRTTQFTAMIFYFLTVISRRVITHGQARLKCIPSYSEHQTLHMERDGSNAGRVVLLKDLIQDIQPNVKVWMTIDSSAI